MAASNYPTTIYVIRHAQSAANVAGVDANSTAYRDAPLTAFGREQAASWQQAVKAWGVQRVLCSPLTRTIQTACIMFNEVDCPVELSRSLRERWWHMPEAKGSVSPVLEHTLELLTHHPLSSAAARRIVPQSVAKLRTPHRTWDPLNEESFSESELAARSEQALAAVWLIFQRPERVVAVVSHAGTIARVFHRPMPNAAAIKLTCKPGNMWTVEPVPFPDMAGVEPPPALPAALPRQPSREVHPTEQAPQLLCLAGRETSQTVQRVAQQLKWSFVPAASIADAKEKLRSSGPWRAVVAALGTRPETQLLDVAADSSSLIEGTGACPGPPAFVVYSKTAVDSYAIWQCCLDAGADYVVNDESTLLVSLTAHDAPDVPPTALETVRQIAAAPPVAPSSPRSHAALPADYDPIRRRVKRDTELAKRYGAAHQVVQMSMKVTQRLLKSVEKTLQAGHQLTSRGAVAPGACIRVVHVSDTHGAHEWLHLPPGDVLIHTGDTVNKYAAGQSTSWQFGRFCDWLIKVSKRYRVVIFIAGNHDTQLQAAKPDSEVTTALQRVRQNAPNVVYLNNGQTVVDGWMRVWGSPCTPARTDEQGRPYKSSAFEVADEARAALWANIPAGTHLLMTHCGPAGVEGTSPGDELLASRLRSLGAQGPQFHCFGHLHGQVGIFAQPSISPGTVFINGAQESMLKTDRILGGTAWVFDVCKESRKRPLPEELTSLEDRQDSTDIGSAMSVATKYIIVLGTGEEKSLRERTARAVRVLQEMESKWMANVYDANTLGNDSAAVMIFSGRSPEAENMREIAKELLRDDFPSDRLVLENTSVNTWQNIVNSREILYRYDLHLGEEMEVFVVSSAFHIPRVRIICDELFDKFCKVKCVPTEEPITEFCKNRENMLIRDLKKYLVEVKDNKD